MATDKQIKKLWFEWISSKGAKTFRKVMPKNPDYWFDTKEFHDLMNFIASRSADKALCILCRKKKPVICGYCKQAEMEAAAEAERNDWVNGMRKHGHYTENTLKSEIKQSRAEGYKQGAEAAYKEGYLVGRDEAEQQLETGFEGTLFQAEEKARAEGYKQGAEDERKRVRK